MSKRAYENEVKYWSKLHCFQENSIPEVIFQSVLMLQKAAHYFLLYHSIYS